MNRTVEMVIEFRHSMLKILEGLPIEALNAIPPGFNNNLIWNFGHVLVSQQSMCYLTAGLQPLVAESYMVKYRRGTKPEKPVDQAEFDDLKKISEAVLPQLDRDLDRNLFTQFKPFTTSYGPTIAGIDDALKMLLFHEGLHLGYCMALKRAQGNRGNRSL